MANTLYDKAREGFAQGLFNWNVDDVQVVLLSAAYVFDAAHIYRADLGGVAIIAGPVAIVNRTSVGGAVDGDNVTFTTVTGSQITAIAIYVNTGNPNTSPLLAYINVATGLPITPNGGNIILTWDNGPNKIFRL